MKKYTLLLVLALIGTCALAWAYTRVKSHRRLTTGAPARTTKSPSLGVTSGNRSSKDIDAGIARNPEAYRQAHALGNRFRSQGQDVSKLDGIVTLAGEERRVRIRRQQDENGEKVELELHGRGGTASFIWSSTGGLQVSGGGRALNADQVLLERLVLDSPDQFILAVLRGASYYTIGHDVRPAEAGRDDKYQGPLWKLIRVQEPIELDQVREKSKWQVFYVNTRTGLIDRIVSQEQTDTITAEIREWADVDGEKVPAHITWSRSGEAVMDYRLAEFAHGRQL